MLGIKVRSMNISIFLCPFIAFTKMRLGFGETVVISIVPFKVQPEGGAVQHHGHPAHGMLNGHGVLF